MKALVAVALLACPIWADAISDIVGPVPAYGTSPWTFYDITAKALADTVPDRLLAYQPVEGEKLPGTYTLSRGSSPNTLTGTMTPTGVAVNDQLLIHWNSVDGPGLGRLHAIVQSVAGNVIVVSTPATNGVNQAVAKGGLVGLEVYHCTRCFDDVIGPGSIAYYSCGYWGLCNLNGSNSWNFYDPALAVYRMYLRTGNSTYLTKFRQFTDAWWVWAIGSGAKGLGGPPRGVSLTSQFVRALDGHPERLPVLYAGINDDWYFDVFSYPKGQDNRESGYMLLFNAVGARADPDPTRHTQYCLQLSRMSQAWLDIQSGDGSWPEKNGPYPYDSAGMSPWRSFATLQGLARAYDSLHDTTATGCNNTTLAASVLTAVQNGAAFAYTRGMSGTDPKGLAYSRAVHYDVNYAAEGQIGVGNPKAGSCTVSVGSPVINCTGTSLLTDFACNGTDFIGITDSVGSAWTHKVASCASNTQATLADDWGTQCIRGVKGFLGTYTPITTCEGSFTSVNQIFESQLPSTDCHSEATTCRHLPGRAGNFDLVWIMGWLYKTTGDSIWKTQGDELFSSAYGGPGSGSGGRAACTGPACDGYNTQFGDSLGGCGYNLAPCNPNSNYGGAAGPEMNTYVFLGKTWGQADGIGGASNYLVWRGGTRAPDPPPLPSAPADVSASPGNEQVVLSWAAVSGATAYNVYRATASGGEGESPIATSVGTLSFADTGLTNGVKYYYKIRATAAGGEGESPIATSVGTLSFADTGLTNGVEYYYKISAVSAAGESSFSSEVSGKPFIRPRNVR